MQQMDDEDEYDDDDDDDAATVTYEAVDEASLQEEVVEQVEERCTAERQMLRMD